MPVDSFTPRAGSLYSEYICEVRALDLRAEAAPCLVKKKSFFPQRKLTEQRGWIPALT